MLSILIPTYNYNIVPLVKRLHAEALLLAVPFEIIARDDASSKSIVENESISTLVNVSFKKNGTNLGHNATRDRLANEANFGTLLFLDTDVMPAGGNFIKKYLDNAQADVVCGGITYKGVTPKSDEMLRYTYGVKSEQQPAAARAKRPYFIMMGNLRVKKNMFLKINTRLDNSYGSDVLLSFHLKKENASVVHINNPVNHFGLEPSQRFLEKSLQAVNHLVEMERQNLLPNNFTKLQRGYRMFKKLGLLGPTYWFIKKRGVKMVKNLLGRSPNVRCFNLYRLGHYINLQRAANA
ncbi:MAG: glycosyltransferase [Marinirhabdus sp.]